MNHDFDENSEMGWQDGAMDQVVQFDFDSVDLRLSELEELPEDVQQQTAVALARLFAFVWSGHGNLRSSLTRFTGLFMGLRPDLVAKTYSEVGGELRVTKQNVSKAVVRAERLLQTKFTRTRSLDGRRHMRQARLRNPVGRNVGQQAARGVS